MGIFITLAEPTSPMKTEAVKTGYYKTDVGKYPKIQILTIENYSRVRNPSYRSLSAFKKAQAEPRSKQERLF